MEGVQQFISVEPHPDKILSASDLSSLWRQLSSQNCWLPASLTNTATKHSLRLQTHYAWEVCQGDAAAFVVYNKK